MILKRFRFLPVILLLFSPAWIHAQTPRIDPAGIGGALLLCGRGDVATAAVAKFFILASGDNAKVLVLTFGNEGDFNVVVGQLRACAETHKAEVELLHLTGDKKEMSKVAEAANQATGIWLAGEIDTQAKAAGHHELLEEICRAALKRKVVLGANGNGVEFASQELYQLPNLPRFSLLPDSCIDRSGQGDFPIGSYPGRILYEIGPGATLLLNGRTLSALGDKAVGVSYRSTRGPIRKITLQGKSQQDLTALRRAAFDSMQSFPPAKVEAPNVERGTLVIVGGGGSPAGMYEKFVEYAGGPEKAKIVLFPTAATDPLPKRDAVANVFRKAGAKKVTILYGQTQSEVESKEFLETLKEATGIWFDGGRQWRFVDCYENTKALPLMFDVLQRGGVIGGTSAGATIQGDYLCRGGVFHNFDIRYEGYERGLGFLKGVAIDQHFSQRKRQGEMTSLMKIYPQYLGIGLDEATAIVVKGHVADVIGKGQAHFYDAARKVDKGQPDYEALSAGGRYDLKARKVLTEGK